MLHIAVTVHHIYSEKLIWDSLTKQGIILGRYNMKTIRYVDYIAILTINKYS